MKPFLFKFRHILDYEIFSIIVAGVIMGGGMALASPVHHFTFDESAEGVVDAVDVAGGLTGVFSGSAVRTGGLFGSVGALRMNDTAGGVNIGSSLALEASTGLTIVAVVDADWTGLPANYDQIFRKEDGNSRILFCFQNDVNNGAATPPVAAGPVLSFGLQVEGTGYQELDMPLDGQAGRPLLADLATGTHVLAVSYDVASGVKGVWVDGDLVFRAEYAPGSPFAFVNGGGDGWIGADRGAEPWNGVIDEVRIYDRALSALEMQALVPGYGANKLPTVSVTSPVPVVGGSLAVPAAFALTAAANDPDGVVSVVEFFINGQTVARATQPPFTVPVKISTAGTHVLTVAAIDDRGGRTVSAPVTLTVTGVLAPPLTVVDGLRLRLAADAGVVVGPGDSVSTWDDQSPNRHAALQADPEQAPRLVTAALNGKPVLRFDGVDDYLEIASDVTLQPLSGDWTVFFVGKRNEGSQGDFPQVIGSRPWMAGLDAGWSVAFNGASGVLGSHYADGAAGHDVPQVVSFTPLSLDTFQVWQVEENRGLGTTAFAVGGVVDRLLSTSMPVAAIEQAEAVAIGREMGGSNTRRASMDLAEVLIYGRVLGAAESDGVVGYLSGKYALPLVQNVNVVPTAALTSPVPGAVLETPSTLVLTAAAADVDGTVASVQFFRGGTLLGTRTAAPYQWDIDLLTLGEATFRVVVTDNLGAVTSSIPVTVTLVGVPPGVAVGKSKLIRQLHYSDSFTIGGGAVSAERQGYGAQTYPLPFGVDLVESSYGNPEQSWGSGPFSIATDAANFPTGVAPYPGTSGAGSDTGFTQRGGAGDWSLPYGLSDDFVVQFDYVQQPDRVDVTFGPSGGGIGDPGNISLFFRTSGHALAQVGLYSPGVGEFDTGLTTAIAAPNTWNNYAVRVSLVDRTIEVFTNQVSRGVIDLKLVRDGAYAGLMANEFIGIGGAGNDRQWSDNFQVGLAVAAPVVASPVMQSLVRAADGSSATLVFASQPNRIYAVDYSISLQAAGQPGGWQQLTGSLASQGTQTEYTDRQAAGLPHAFYRVRDVTQ
jgi:hypothetical protein